MESLETILQIIPLIVTIASAITALTDTPKDDHYLAKVYKIIEILALVNDKVKNK